MSQGQRKTKTKRKKLLKNDRDGSTRDFENICKGAPCTGQVRIRHLEVSASKFIFSVAPLERPDEGHSSLEDGAN